MKIEDALKAVGLRFIGGYRSRTAGRNKYRPHIGAKERARHAGKPDGLMHGKGTRHV